MKVIGITKLWIAFSITTLVTCIGLIIGWWFNYECKFVENINDWYFKLEDEYDKTGNSTKD